MNFLYPFHPRTVHFPIALSLSGALFILLAILVSGRGNGQGVASGKWLGFGRLSLGLSWLGVLAAVATGLIDQSHAPDDPAVASVISVHITIGIALMILLGLAIYWPLRDRGLWAGRHRWGYLALMAGVVILVLAESWLGGKLVYELGVGVGRVP